MLCVNKNPTQEKKKLNGKKKNELNSVDARFWSKQIPKTCTDSRNNRKSVWENQPKKIDFKAMRWRFRVVGVRMFALSLSSLAFVLIRLQNYSSRRKRKIVCDQIYIFTRLKRSVNRRAKWNHKTRKKKKLLTFISINWPNVWTGSPENRIKSKTKNLINSKDLHSQFFFRSRSLLTFQFSVEMTKSFPAEMKRNMNRKKSTICVQLRNFNFDGKKWTDFAVEWGKIKNQIEILSRLSNECEWIISIACEHMHLRSFDFK